MKDETKIGLDLDGVIINHVPNKLKVAADFGYDLEPAQVSSNFMHRFMPRHEYEKLKDVIYGEATLSAPPIDMSIESLSRLPGEVYIISARRDYNRSMAWEWLERHGVLEIVPRDRIIFVSDSRSKIPVVEDVHITTYLDDQIRVLGLLPAAVERYLLDTRSEVPTVGLSPDIRVVGGWPQFLKSLAE